MKNPIAGTEKEPEPFDPNEYIKELRKKQGYMPIGDHLEDLRIRIIRIVIWLFIFSCLCYFFYDITWDFIMGPLKPLFDSEQAKKIGVKLIATELGDYFLITIQTSVMGGLLLALPAIFWEIWSFILPALKKTGRLMGFAILFSAVTLFWTGIAFSRFYVWPIVIQFLVIDWIPPAKPVPSELHLILSDYLGFFMGFHFAFGAAFEIPIVSLLLGLAGILKSKLFFINWRMAILVIAVVSAIVTPPDVYSQIAMMLPLTVLYFLSALLVWLTERKSAVQ